MKLLWNTNKNLSNKTVNRTDKRIMFWGNYHYENSYSWVLDLLSKIKIETIDSIESLNKNESVIIIDNIIDRKESFYFDLSSRVKKIYLIHLGDEGGSEKIDLIYSLCEHIWRTFYLPKFISDQRISCIPIGYKAKVPKSNLEISKKKYIWSFLGTTHGSSRYDLLEKHKEIKPNLTNLTDEFGGANSLATDAYYNVMENSIFTLVPHGYYHPETYRLYEALECRSIPIVENPYNFFDNFFPDSPFIKIDNWKDSSKQINELLKKTEEMDVLANKINLWWSNYKELLRKNFERMNNV